MNETHLPNDQFNFNGIDGVIRTENFELYRGNKFTKSFINNRHDLKMSKYNNAGYGFQIFRNGQNVGSIWFLNQVNSKTTYVRVSRYQSTQHGNFIAILSELSEFFEKQGYSLVLKTQIEYAQTILSQNFVGVYSKKSAGKRGKNDRSTKSVAVDGYTYHLWEHADTYDKWHDEKVIFEA